MGWQRLGLSVMLELGAGSRSCYCCIDPKAASDEREESQPSTFLLYLYRILDINCRKRQE